MFRTARRTARGGPPLSSGAIQEGVQDRFAHNEERIYEQAKALTNAIQNVIGRAEQARGGIDPIRALALALQVREQARKMLAKNSGQPDLFNESCW